MAPFFGCGGGGGSGALGTAPASQLRAATAPFFIGNDAVTHGIEFDFATVTFHRAASSTERGLKVFRGHKSLAE